jgi:hypothetical protein
LPGVSFDLNQRPIPSISAFSRASWFVGIEVRTTARRSRRERRLDAGARQAVDIVRTIVAVVIAIAVAVMPASAGGIAAGRMTQDASSGAVHSATMSMDCMHHHAPGHRGSKNADDPASFAACAAKCFNFAGVGAVAPAFAAAPTASRLRAVVVARRVTSNLAAPPFRPPRV